METVTITTLIATLTEIKTILGTSSITTYDNFIKANLPIVQDYLLNSVLRNNFGFYLDEDDVLIEGEFPNDLKLVIADMIAFRLFQKPGDDFSNLKTVLKEETYNRVKLVYADSGFRSGFPTSFFTGLENYKCFTQTVLIKTNNTSGANS